MSFTSLRLQAMNSPWVRITKPGILFGNLVSVLGGLWLGARGMPALHLVVLASLGTMMVVASGCVVNNIIDRDIDGRMARTCTRVLVQGEISIRAAAWYAVALGVPGLAFLALCSPLAAAAGLAGYVVYVGLYTLLFKRSSVYGTVVGSFSGAMPPVIGYVAAWPHLDMAALLLFVAFSLWQLPHSYAIAIFRQGDYANVGIPVLPLVRGLATTRRHMIWTTLACVLASLLLVPLGYSGLLFGVGVAAVGAYWLSTVLRLPAGPLELGDPASLAWARKVFAGSLIYVMALCLLMALDQLLR
ncbi:heme o synthase [Amphibiibacter pelophylacis]|uniref:Heme o synthase n=1 Tax=Amphibiibacter pelophylacis TaxID=1799477 RepID=A0ACC6P3Y6_9BURK